MNDATMPRPTSDDSNEWKAYWTAQDEPWRIEPEISLERQNELKACYSAIEPNAKEDAYPFKDMHLSRADIEWLLHKFEPVDWQDEFQRLAGLDLRGVMLKTGTWLIGLPLNRTDFSKANLEGANLNLCDLNEAIFREASMDGATFMSANLEGADFIQASLRATDFAHANIKRAFFAEAHLDYASFIEAHLESALLDEAHLEGANLSRVHLEGASLIGVHLKGSLLRAANIEGADLRSADLKETDLREAHLEGSNLDSAHLEGANFHSAHLEGADLGACHLEGASLQGTHMEGKRLNDTDYQRINQAMRGYGIAVPQLLPPTDLRMAYMNEATTLNDLTLSNSQGCVKVADVRWGGINLAVISWNQQGITRLGDENEARKPLDKNGKPKDHTTRIREWEAAVRAYRQLAVALRTQGMNEVADRFAYRAQFCQRRVTHFGGLRSLPAYLGSLLLDLISGYGYRPARSLATYALVIGVFALIYGILGQSSHPLNPQEAVVISMTAFHGRGFFATSFSPGDPQAIAAAIEAFVGLFIEVTFIATFTQRFFSR